MTWWVLLTETNKSAPVEHFREQTQISYFGNMQLEISLFCPQRFFRENISSRDSHLTITSHLSPCPLFALQAAREWKSDRISFRFHSWMARGTNTINHLAETRLGSSAPWSPRNGDCMSGWMAWWALPRWVSGWDARTWDAAHVARGVFNRWVRAWMFPVMKNPETSSGQIRRLHSPNYEATVDP